MDVKYDNGDIEIRVDGGAWQVIKAERVQDEGRLKIRANIDGNISTYSANIDGGNVTLFLEVSKLLKYPLIYSLFGFFNSIKRMVN